MAKHLTINVSLILLLVFGVANPCIGLAENPEETGDYVEGDIVSIAPSLLQGRSRAGILGDRYRWPDATIPYEFSAGYPTLLQAVFRRAIQHISERTCIKFVPRTNQRDYISVISGTGCYSHVGRIGGKQDVSLPTQCNRLGTFVHELIHAIGFLHEQSRTDRDDYVEIKFDRIRPGTERNFQKYGNTVIGSFGVTYDYGSIMHYPRTAFTKDGRETIVPKTSTVEIGQRRGMSTQDATKVNNMYCKDKRSGKEQDAPQHQKQRQLKLF